MSRLFVELQIGAEVKYLSLDGYAGSRWCEPAIINIDTIQYRVPEFYGGYAKLTWGSISFIPSLFGDSWPPPINAQIIIKFGDDDVSAVPILSGICHLSSFNRDEVTYDIYSENFDQEALEEATDALDRNGDPLEDALYPIAFGVVTHKTPLRVGSPDEYRYHKACLSGSVGVDWHVYDDGVNIDSNVIDNGDGTFSLTASPVGEVTVSGTGSIRTLIDVFSWGANKLGLELDTTFARSPSPIVGYWLSSKMKVVDLLDNFARFYTHCFYIHDGTLYLVDMFQFTFEISLTEFDFFPSEYTQDSPIKSVSSRWTIRVPVVDNTGAHLKDEHKEVTLFFQYTYGSELSIVPMHEVYGDVKAALQNIMSLASMKRMRLRLPLTSMYYPGQKFSWVDTALVAPVSVYVIARTIQYDLNNWEVVIEGEGSVEPL